jgi:hypothetical protein
MGASFGGTRDASVGTVNVACATSSTLLFLVPTSNALVVDAGFDGSLMLEFTAGGFEVTSTVTFSLGFATSLTGSGSLASHSTSRCFAIRLIRFVIWRYDSLLGLD